MPIHIQPWCVFTTYIRGCGEDMCVHWIEVESAQQCDPHNIYPTAVIASILLETLMLQQAHQGHTCKTMATHTIIFTHLLAWAKQRFKIIF